MAAAVKSSVRLPSTLPPRVTYTYVNILQQIFIYMYGLLLGFYKAEYIFSLEMS